MSDISKPVDIFESDEQLLHYLKWWQDKLFLNDWIITCNICSPDKFTLENSVAENVFSMVNMSSTIRILDPEYYGERILKYCAELSLVHELLHCKYNWVRSDDDYTGRYVDTKEHMLLEQMARSLIMAKYDVGLDYFSNV